MFQLIIKIPVQRQQVINWEQTAGLGLVKDPTLGLSQYLATKISF